MSLLTRKVNPWLLPIMAAPNNAIHGNRRQLYRNRVIWVDYGAAENGDGTRGNPLDSLDAVFDDDEVECTCRALCCDEIVVRVKGAIGETLDKLPESMLAVDGKGRDYAGRLRIRPWDDGGRISAKIAVDLTIDDDFTARTDLVIVGNVRGIILQDADLAISVTAHYEKPEDAEDDSEDDDVQPDIRILGRMVCVDGVTGSRFPGSKADVNVVMDVVVDPETKVWKYYTQADDMEDGEGGPGWGYGGGGGGGGVGGGSGGGSGDGTGEGGSGEWDEYEFPRGDDEGDAPWWLGGYNVQLLMVGFYGCNRGDFTSAASTITANVRATGGIRLLGRNIQNARRAIMDAFIGHVDVDGLAVGGGDTYEVYEDDVLIESGVRNYALQVEAQADTLLGLTDSSIVGAIGDTAASANVEFKNEPHRTNHKTGTTSKGTVGGMSEASAVGVRNSTTMIYAADMICAAQATHPRRYGWRVRAYHNSRDIIDSTGTPDALHTNIPGWGE